MIEPIFNFNGENVVLNEGTCSIIDNGINYEGTAQIKFVFLPKAKVVIEAEFNDHRVAPLIDKTIDFFIDKNKINVFIVSSKLQISPMLSKIKFVSKNSNIKTVLEAENKVKSIIFHLFNFYNFMDYNKLIHIG